MVLIEYGTRTATTSSPDQRADRTHRGVRLYLDVTAAAGSQNLTVQIQGLDPASDKWVDATKFSNVSSTGIYQCELYPGAVNTGSVTGLQVQGGSLPRTWRAVVTHSSTGSWAYSRGAHLVP